MLATGRFNNSQWTGGRGLYGKKSLMGSASASEKKQDAQDWRALMCELIMELVLPDLTEELDNPETGLEAGRLCAGCDLLCGRRGGVDGLAMLWEEVLEFVGSKVCLDGNARHAIAHRSAQANKCHAKWRPVLKSSWLPRMLRLNKERLRCGRPSSGVRVSGRRSRPQKDKIASWSARMVANVIGGWDWTSGGDSGTELVIGGSRKATMNELTAIRERISLRNVERALY